MAPSRRVPARVHGARHPRQRRAAVEPVGPRESDQPRGHEDVRRQHDDQDPDHGPTVTSLGIDEAIESLPGRVGIEVVDEGLGGVGRKPVELGVLGGLRQAAGAAHRRGVRGGTDRGAVRVGRTGRMLATMVGSVVRGARLESAARRRFARTAEFPVRTG